jgi:hypothetical protein
MDALNYLFVNLREAITTWLAGFLPKWAAEAVVHFGVGLILIVIGLLAVMALTLGERKVVGRFQDRYGPNRWGPWGILTPVADAIKMLTKEDIVPEGADYWVHLLAPICTITAAVLIYAVLPFGEGMWGTDLNIGILYIVAIASLGWLLHRVQRHEVRDVLHVGVFQLVRHVCHHHHPLPRWLAWPHPAGLRLVLHQVRCGHLSLLVGAQHDAPHPH